MLAPAFGVPTRGRRMDSICRDLKRGYAVLTRLPLFMPATLPAQPVGSQTTPVSRNAGSKLIPGDHSDNSKHSSKMLKAVNNLAIRIDTKLVREASLPPVQDNANGHSSQTRVNLSRPEEQTSHTSKTHALNRSSHTNVERPTQTVEPARDTTAKRANGEETKNRQVINRVTSGTKHANKAVQPRKSAGIYPSIARLPPSQLGKTVAKMKALPWPLNPKTKINAPIRINPTKVDLKPKSPSVERPLEDDGDTVMQDDTILPRNYHDERFSSFNQNRVQAWHKIRNIPVSVPTALMPAKALERVPTKALERIQVQKRRASTEAKWITAVNEADAAYRQNFEREAARPRRYTDTTARPVQVVPNENLYVSSDGAAKARKYRPGNVTDSSVAEVHTDIKRRQYIRRLEQQQAMWAVETKQRRAMALDRQVKCHQERQAAEVAAKATFERAQAELKALHLKIQQKQNFANHAAYRRTQWRLEAELRQAKQVDTHLRAQEWVAHQEVDRYDDELLVAHFDEAEASLEYQGLQQIQAGVAAVSAFFSAAGTLTKKTAQGMERILTATGAQATSSGAYLGRMALSSGGYLGKTTAEIYTAFKTQLQTQAEQIAQELQLAVDNAAQQRREARAALSIATRLRQLELTRAQTAAELLRRKQVADAEALHAEQLAAKALNDKEKEIRAEQLRKEAIVAGWRAEYEARAAEEAARQAKARDAEAERRNQAAEVWTRMQNVLAEMDEERRTAAREAERLHQARLAGMSSTNRARHLDAAAKWDQRMTEYSLQYEQRDARLKKEQASREQWEYTTKVALSRLSQERQHYWTKQLTSQTKANNTLQLQAILDKERQRATKRHAEEYIRAYRPN